MSCEIGAFVPKGRGARLAHALHADARVSNISVEAGRTTDLFHFREFGSASEVDIVTIIVDAVHRDAVFDEVHALANLDAPDTGIIFLMPALGRVAGV